MWNEESEAVDHGGVGHGVECLGGRPHQPAGPFHYLISEQAKSLVALQELQHEVGALLEFRDLVMETFPNLRSKLQQQQTANSTPATMTGHHHSNIPISIRPGDWTPGIRVRKKLGVVSSSKDKKGSTDSAATGSSTSAVQDSGFSTEASSKETHSASSTAPPTSTSATGTSETDDTEDELWNLLDIIHRKGTRLKDEVEALQGTLRDQTPFGENANFQRALFHSSADDIRQLRQERDLLLERLAEMEAEVLAGRLHTSRLQEDLENLLSAKHDLEEQLKAIVSQRGEVNSRIHDLHLQFVTKSASEEKLKMLSGERKDSSQTQSASRTTIRRRYSGSALDNVLGDFVPKVSVPDRNKIAAILKEQDPLVLQKHLLVSTVQNQVLREQLDSAVELTQKLDKAREENEDLRFQLEDRTIELEGTKARVRLLEDLHKPNLNKCNSPDIIPDIMDTSQDQRPLSRTEITTASMKAMSPIPMTLQLDHSSSTESAHDQAETSRSKDGSGSKRRPSKIPLKSYTAPKPPGGKHSPAPRSRSGESPHRSHSAHSWRNRSATSTTSPGDNSLKNSLPKSRNSSLVSARDSLSIKLRSSETVMTVKGSPTCTIGTPKKTSAPTKWGPPKDEKVQISPLGNEKFQSPWILSSYKAEQQLDDYPDSLMEKSSIQQTITDSESHRFQTANTFLWENRQDFYDSIDSNMASSNCCYRSNGEDLAECDSLEKHLASSVSFGKK
ncbi:javelin-like isoform X2 [Rhynchophorus ferrugineus]|uniref:javelin-like isoform X2 n=1 Tax=Rhynchophorus ferrugineus TaxID=354439 RepID=UPI003FCE71FC